MQRLTKLLLVWLLVGLLPTGSASAQSTNQTQTADRTLLGQLQQQTNGQLQIERHAETGKVRFLATTPGQPIKRSRTLLASATPEQAARGFLANYGALFGLRAQTDELVTMRAPSFGDRSFVRFQQRYHGVPVLGGELVVQTDGQRNVVTANGEALPDITVDTTPSVSAQRAQEQARTVVAQTYKLNANQLTAGQPQLSIFNPALLGGPGLRITHLAWRVDVQSSASGTPVRELVLVDAHMGKVMLHFNQIAYDKERHICDDKNVPDADQDETNDCPTTSYVRNENDGVSNIPDVDLAYDYSGATYDYYKQQFGRDSIDNSGMPLISLVRYCPGSCPFQNAFWDGQQMTYGDGFASADDVVGHELTHGVTEHTSGLFYYYQAGAINESMSDVFGELIDLNDGLGNDAASVRWQLGEDLSIGAIRNMADPPNVPGHIGDPAYQSPDRMNSPYYYSDTQDNGGVHTNSGVNNKAAFLMADGGSFNSYTIRGLGLDKMGQIYYRTNTAFLTSGSDYQDLGDDLQAACQSLIGTAGITADDCAEVTKIVKATEMDQEPTGASTPEAAVCASGKYAADVFADDLENAASGNWISAPVTGTVNEWYYPQQSAPLTRTQQIAGASYATSGKNNFWGYDQGPNDFQQPSEPGDYAIAMTHDVILPANAFFHFRHAYDFETGLDYNTFNYVNFDGGVVEYSMDSGTTWQDAGPLFDEHGYDGTLPQESDTDNPLHDRPAFVGVSYGYTSSRANLSPLAGKQVRFRFRIGTDSYGDAYGWFIDDIRVYTCSDTPPAPQPKVTFSSTTMQVDEDAGQVLLPVTLSSASAVTVTVNYSVTGGTGVAGKDYTLASNTLVFPPNVTAQTIPVGIIHNPDSSADRTVVMSLNNPRQATLGTNTSFTLTIANKDVFDPSGAAIRIFLPLLSR